MPTAGQYGPIQLGVGGQQVGAGPMGHTQPLIAVVIPAYKQPGYLQDAMASVLRQSMRARIKTVIVNDGCPYQSTDELGQLYRGAYPEEVFYLRKENGGPSSARNYGIRFALEAWPSIQAVFPLDADNVLSPHTVERLWKSLTQSPDVTGWVYQDLIVFGTEEFTWHAGIPFSMYRLIHEHFCDTGALIHRRVFDAGIFYDEDMKWGYEDWEFHIRASLDGFKGIHAPGTGFFYRSHGHSRNEDARDAHHEIYQYILQKHASHLQQRRLVGIEHEELPRYAIASPDTDLVTWGTDPCDPAAPTRTISSFFDAIVSWENEPKPKSGYIPPLTIVGTSRVKNLLQRLGLLRGVLFAIQGLAARHTCVQVTCELSEDPYMLKLDRGEPTDRASLIAVPTRALLDAAMHSGDGMRALMKGSGEPSGANLTLRLGLAHVMHASAATADRYLTTPAYDTLLPSVVGPAIDMLDELSTRLRGTPRSKGLLLHEQPSVNRFIAGNAYFASQHQLDRGIAAFPYVVRPDDDGRRPVNVWFTTAWIGLGGLDQIVLNLAAQLAALNPLYRVHLVVTDANEIEADPRSLDAFDTVTFLDAEKGRKEQALVNILSDADLIVNAHSRATYDALRRLKSEMRVPVVSLLQVSDLGKFGVPRGYPILASRHCEPLIDYFVVPSRQLKRACVNLGVPEDKLLIIPNAPVVHPRTVNEALTIAQEKDQRTFSAARPIRILFAGRFDEQKGFDRLGPILEQLRERDVPFDFRIVGKAVLSHRNPIDALPDATLLPATHDPVTLARYYTDADVFLLPSRWEGVPLSILDAMAFGNVVVTTDVGATGEVVVDGKNGFLVDPELPEDDIVTSSCRLIAGIASRAMPCRAVREEAVRTAMSYSWHDSAAQLAALVENLGLE